MNQNRKSDVLSYNDKLSDEIYNINTLVNAMIICCREKEFKNEYYGIPQKFIPMLSNERNENLSLLSLISNKLKILNNLSLYLDKEQTLHQNTDYCSR